MNRATASEKTTTVRLSEGEFKPAAVVKLEAVFEGIYRDRMQGLPIVNPALQVRAIGFQAWRDNWLGALVTPWFINLILLPDKTSMPPGFDKPVGSDFVCELPCGSLTFTVNHETTLGRFAACSLMSPVLDIPTQQTAESIAREAMDCLFQERTQSEHDADSAELARFRQGVVPSSDECRDGKPGKHRADAAGEDNSVCSRRAFLRRLALRPRVNDQPEVNS